MITHGNVISVGCSGRLWLKVMSWVFPQSFIFPSDFDRLHCHLRSANDGCYLDESWIFSVSIVIQLIIVHPNGSSYEKYSRGHTFCYQMTGILTRVSGLRTKVEDMITKDLLNIDLSNWKGLGCNQDNATR